MPQLGMLVKGYSRLLPFGRSSTAKLSRQGSFHQCHLTYTVTVEIGASGTRLPCKLITST